MHDKISLDFGNAHHYYSRPKLTQFKITVRNLEQYDTSLRHVGSEIK